MSKYIDLAEEIFERLDMPCGTIRLGVSEALAYIDRNPDQVPRRAITQSEMTRVLSDYNAALYTKEETMNRLGIAVVPDPEPTNAELLAIYLGLHDLDAITQAGVAEFARQLDADGVKAPGGDDE